MGYTVRKEVQSNDFKAKIHPKKEKWGGETGFNYSELEGLV